MTRLTAPPSGLQLSLPPGRRGPDRGEVARAAVAQFKGAVAQGRSTEAAANLLLQGAYSARHLGTLNAVVSHYQTVLAEQGLAPWPLSYDKVVEWLVHKHEVVLAAGETRAADHYSGALSDLLAGARTRGERPLADWERGRLAQICVTLSNATPLTERRQAIHLTDVALEVMERQVPRLPWARQVLTMARVMLAGKLRSGPVVAMRWENVTEGVDADGQPWLRLKFPWEKTERDRIAVLRPDPDPQVCGYRALLAWRESTQGSAAGAGAQHASGPVFPHLDPRTHAVDRGQCMTQPQFSSRMQMLARAAGLPDAERYTGHIGRSGGATRALLDGAAPEEVMHQGRWRSRSSFNKYDRRDSDAAVRAGLAPLLVRARAGAGPGRGRPVAPPPPSPPRAPPAEASRAPGPARSVRIEPAAGAMRALNMSDEADASEESSRGLRGDPDDCASGGSATGTDDDPSLDEAAAAEAARRASEEWFELNGVPAEWRDRSWLPTPEAGKRDRLDLAGYPDFDGN